jgi:hypothetical protein
MSSDVIFNNHDIINIFITLSTNKTVASILCVNKATSKLSSYYKNNVFKYAIARELKYVYNCFDRYLRFKIGDRAYTEEGLNYKITKIDKNECEMIQVDTLGNDLGFDSIKIGKYLSFDSWTTTHGESVRSGILLYENGPKILDTKSIYLKYKTLKVNTNPELNMLVRVSINNDKNRDGSINFEGSRTSLTTDYIITRINENQMVLKDINNIHVKHSHVGDVLVADKINNRWIVANHNHRIIYDYYDQY